MTDTRADFETLSREAVESPYLFCGNCGEGIEKGGAGGLYAMMMHRAYYCEVMPDE